MPLKLLLKQQFPILPHEVVETVVDVTVDSVVDVVSEAIS
jgi:hypothetical protein